MSANAPYKVEICATLLTNKPPRLPLREELPSLGFEVIYEAEGLVAKTSRLECKRAVDEFRKAEQMKDLTKRRIFPKSSRKIREKLAERKRIERELKVQHAISYESFERQLYEDESYSTGSSRSGSPSTSTDPSSQDANKGSDRFARFAKRKGWGLFKKKSSEDTSKVGNKVSAKGESEFNSEIPNVFGQADFKDLLAPANNNIDEVSSDEDHQGEKRDLDRSRLGTTAASTAPSVLSSEFPSVLSNGFGSSLSTPKQMTPQNMEIQFVASPTAEKYLPDLKTVDESDDGDDEHDTKLKERVDDKRNALNGQTRADTSDEESSSDDGIVYKSQPHTIDLISPTENEQEQLSSVQSEKDTRSHSLVMIDSPPKPKQLDPSPPRMISSDNSVPDNVGCACIGDVKSTFENWESSNKVYLTAEPHDSIAMPSHAAMTLNATETIVTENEISHSLSPRFEKEVIAQAFADFDASIYEQMDTNGQKRDPKRATVEKQVTFSSKQDGIYVNKGKGSLENEEEPLPQVALTSSNDSDTSENNGTSTENETGDEGEEVLLETEEFKKKESTENSDEGWLSSAKHALQNVAAGVIKVAGIGSLEEEDKKVLTTNANDSAGPTYSSKETKGMEKQEGKVESPMSAHSKRTLFEVLAHTGTDSADVKSILDAAPGSVQVKQHHDGRLPLHTLCDRGMPNRMSMDSTDLTDTLVRDISSYKRLIELVMRSYPDAATTMDRRGDLPVHLLARTLMEWEADWYETVYGQASHEANPNGKVATAISMLYHTMSDCVELLLEPVSEMSDLCQEAGSMGLLLPIHIASIFTSSVRTLRLIVEANPDATAIACSLSHLRTFVPDDSLPLELHESLSTDFPKWETEEASSVYPEVKWSRPKDENLPAEDRIRRSDLLFAYNPEIEPYRTEKPRIRRIELRIRLEATEACSENAVAMLSSTKRLWIWMCRFVDRKTGRAVYVNCVQRILHGLPLVSLKYLTSIKTSSGITVTDAANKECLKVIQRRLEEATELEHRDLAAAMLVESRKWDHMANMFQENRCQIAHLCRTLFNVYECSFPTTFVILPYQLAVGENGKLGMASSDSAQVAVKFAECLLQLTDPRSILYFLDMKAVKNFDQSLYEKADDETVRLRFKSTIRNLESSLLALYAPDKAFLYLIDEANGIPVVPGPESDFPIVIGEPASMVRKLLPLMLMGMILMRGDKAFSVLLNVLLNENVTVLAPNWIVAAEGLKTFIKQHEASNHNSQQFKDLVQELGVFGSPAQERKRLEVQPKNGSTEWNVELTLLRMLMDMHDRNRTCAGLRPNHGGGKKVVWTLSPNQPPSGSASQPSLTAGPSVLGAIKEDEELDETSQDASSESEGSVSQAGDSSCNATMESRSSKANSRATKETRDDSSAGAKVLATGWKLVEEIRRRRNEDSVSPREIRDRTPADDEDTSESIPELDDLTFKHLLLKKKHERVITHNTSQSDVDSISCLGFPQPEDTASEDGCNVRGGESLKQHKFSSTQLRQTGGPMLRYHFPQPEDSDSSYDESHKLPRRKTSHSSRSKRGRQNHLHDETLASSTRSSSCRRKHGLLFDELAFKQSSSEKEEGAPDSRNPAGTSRPAVGSESTRIWNEVSDQLDKGGAYVGIPDPRLLRLKVQLAKEAKLLSHLNRKVSIVQRDEMIVLSREEEIKRAFHVDGDCSYEPKVNDGIARARRLLLRLCDLEDRLLFNEIEIQHLSLEAFSLDKHIEELEPLETKLERKAAAQDNPSRLRQRLKELVYRRKYRTLEDDLDGFDRSPHPFPITEVQFRDGDNSTTISGHSTDAAQSGETGAEWLKYRRPAGLVDI